MRYGIETIENRRDATRLFSSLLGSMEFAAAWDLSKKYCQNILIDYILSIHQMDDAVHRRKHRLQNHSI